MKGNCRARVELAAAGLAETMWISCILTGLHAETLASKAFQELNMLKTLCKKAKKTDFNVQKIGRHTEPAYICPPLLKIGKRGRKEASFQKPASSF